MATDACKNCKFYNRQSNSIELANGEFLLQNGFVPNVGTGGEEIAKCDNEDNFWENITRDASTEDFFDSPDKKSVMNYVGALGVGEKDVCPLFSPIKVASIVVTATGNIDFLDVGKTVQMLSEVNPTNAADTSVTWSVEAGGTGSATIDGAGLLTAVSEGTVFVRATANDGSGVYGQMTINVVILVASIIVTGFGGVDTIMNGLTLQMLAAVSPLTATNQNVLWSVENGTGAAIIDELSGVLTGGALGTVTVKATAIDGGGAVGSFEIEII